MNATVSGFSAAGTTVPRAGGPIIFDNGSSRTGRGPQVFQLCPISAAADGAQNVSTVEARADESIPDCPR
ncbi:hypothetical protein [Nocardia sp. NPDC050175]|uniref:hypothetical protein n=1 Tax=Nocardia sp. NPDC050175 TaxID=3364317 RepID=UPI0037B8E020